MAPQSAIAAPGGRNEGALSSGCTKCRAAVVVTACGLAGVVCAGEMPAQVSPAMAKLTPAGAEPHDVFGFSVDIWADQTRTLAVIGAQGADDAGPRSGAAFVFQLIDGSWIQRQRLIASDATEYEEFGFDVDLEGETLLVGARQSNTPAFNSGAAYIFEESPDGQWLETARLEASDAATEAFFGRALALSGDVAAVGAHRRSAGAKHVGGVYLYERGAGSDGWGQTAIVTPDIPVAGEEFGIDVAIETDPERDVLVVGAWLNDDAGFDAGSAYVFERSAGALGDWVQVARLLPDPGSDLAWFGLSVDIAGSTIGVGAPYLRHSSGVLGGAAVAYRRSTSGLWQREALLTEADPVDFAGFGFSVALSPAAGAGSEMLLGVGAIDGDGLVAGTGEASVFTRPDDTAAWELLAEAFAPDGEPFDHFGRDVAMVPAPRVGGRATLIAGAFSDREGCPVMGTCEPGSAYIFRVDCDGDADGSGSVDVGDITFVVNRLGPAGPADVNADGAVDVNDLTFIVNRLGDECP